MNIDADLVNATGPNSKFQAKPNTSGATNLADWYRAHAPRASGILVALGDGSVRQVSAGVTGDTWWYACTPSGGEVLGADW